MHPDKVNRAQLQHLTDLPNVGASIAKDLHRIGITQPDQLRGQSAVDLYQQLCTVDRRRHDPCLLDVFISITRFMDGGPPRAWWHYTAERKTMSIV